MSEEVTGNSPRTDLYREAYETLVRLKSICSTSSIDVLEELVIALGSNGFAVIESQEVPEGYRTRVLVARGELARSQGAFSVSRTGCSGHFDEADWLDRREPDATLLPVLREVSISQSLVLNGVGARVFRSNGEFCLVVSTDRSVARDGGTGAEQRQLLKLALIAFLTAQDDPGLPWFEFSLPKGETDVLSAYAKGLSPKDIAEKRGTSVRTVRAQLDSVRRRLSARSNAHSVAIAVSNNLLPVADLILDRDGPTSGGDQFSSAG